ncbi:MAG: polysaccharide deacetylase family protein [Desulfobacterales bacterium]|nr:polysaccharide deacetylase family protein [Desulfobacterales bacterium]
MKLWERVKYSAIIDREPLRLPDEKTVAVWPLVTVEVWDPDGPMPRTILTPPQEVRYIPDVPNWCWAEYGARIGFWRMKAALDQRGLKSVLCINGSVIDRYPRICGAALEAGWEFMGHNIVQKPMHAMENEEEAIFRTVEVIEKFTGSKPRGWMGPGLTETHNTPELLVKAGIEYTTDWVLDDQPTVIETRNGPLYSIPYSVEVNDVVLMAIEKRPSSGLYERALSTVERYLQEGPEQARVLALACHPFLHGVPHRIGYFEQTLDELAAKNRVMFTTGGWILDWYKAARNL